MYPDWPCEAIATRGVVDERRRRGYLIKSRVSVFKIGSAALHERIERESPVACDALRIFAGAQRIQHGFVYEQVIDPVELVVVGVELPEC